MTDATGTGTWTSSNTGFATIGSTTGIVNGVSAGNLNISYTVTSGSGCFSIATYAITVNALPNAGTITGANNVCVSSNITLSDAISGGTWSSSNTGIATVGSASRIVNGVSAGTININYTITNGSGCVSMATYAITVNALPGAGTITGTNVVCAGGTLNLTDATTGGIWSSSNNVNATVGSTTGIVTALVSSIPIISYTVTSGSGCISVATYAITINPNPNAGTITGANVVCVGSTLTLTDAISFGTWSSSNTSMATVSAGVVTGVGSGTPIISYRVVNGGGCVSYATYTITVNPSPNATISGTNNVCVGSNVTLTDATSGGTWSSSTTSNATIGSITGIVNGISNGTSTISYTVTNAFSCTTIGTYAITVNALPNSGAIGNISGASSVCTGTTITLSENRAGGIWSSSNISQASIGTSGIVTGNSVGTPTISYTITNASGCSASATYSITVNVSPNAGTILGTSVLCVAATTHLSDVVVGGSWTSSDGSLAVIDGTGLVTGVASGNPIISYSVSNTNCTTFATQTLTVNPLPDAGVINGNTSVCIGTSISLSDITTGVSWYSDSTGIATVDGSGNVTGIAIGTININTTITNSCGTDTSAYSIDVISIPDPGLSGVITGTPSICLSFTTILSYSLTGAGGTWNSSNTAIATIDNATGLVYGVAVGTATISYTTTNVCGSDHDFIVVTVNPAPVAISGTNTICLGSSMILSDATAGGTWSSSDATVSTVTTGGSVNSVAAGSAIISYTMAGCDPVTTSITVNPAAIITGNTPICVGNNLTLSNAVSGGTWSSSNTGQATVNSTSGLVSAITAGNPIISYTTTSGCIQTVTLTVNTTPSAISGVSNICTGQPVIFTDAISSGSWTSSNTGLATVGSTTGIVNGVSAGSASISYSLSTGCFAVIPITVNTTPSSITGATSLCNGNSITLSDATGSGTWSSNNSNVSIGSASGVVTGLVAGTSTISYLVSNGCAATSNVTVNALPTSILGTTTFCVGTNSTLSDAFGTGTWTSSDITLATVGSASGTVTAVASGNPIITYITASGCLAVTTITLYAPPASINGANTLCNGTSITLSDVTSGGFWSSSNVSTASVNSGGVVTSHAAGTVIISYNTTSSCNPATYQITVNASPGVINGTTTVCVGSTTSLSNVVSAGTWTSSNALASVGTSGIVTGMSAGNPIISYTLSNGCYVVAPITVNTAPVAISGSNTICGGPITLSESTTGGTWVSSNTAIATVGSTGIVTGITYGTATISYQVTGCTSATLAINVNNPGPILGTTLVCASGATTTLSDITSGGTWTSSAPSLASIGTNGVVTGGTVTGGASFGTANISYTYGGCAVGTTITVNALPTTVLGTATVCATSNITLSDAINSGTWVSANPLIASVGSTTGIVTGQAAGTVNISYTTASCATPALKSVTVNAIPTAILGNPTICTGTNVTISDATGGGTWSSSNTALATIGSTTGVIGGVLAGNPTLSYTLSLTGCYITTIATVNTTPAAISGSNAVCTGGANTITLSDATAGGAWTSSSANATVVGSTGVVTGITTGSATISYSLSGCNALKIVTVNTTPTAILGTAAVCTGLTVTLSDLTASGAWTSSNTSFATVGSTGIVTGVAAGVPTISYTVPNGCLVVAAVTVSTTPNTISGASTVCTGGTNAITLSDATAGGTWTSSAANATVIGSTGVVTGVTVGSVNITYTTGSCFVLKPITISATPTAILGTTAVCTGTTKTLSDLTAGGVWSSSATSIATIGSATAIITPVVAGTTTISYTIPATGCFSTASSTISTTPGAILGTDSVCIAGNVTLSNATPGGTWRSTTTTIATITTGGLITGVAAGNSLISYTVAACVPATVTMSVNATPTNTGTASVCTGLTVTRTGTPTGGTWSSSNTLLATVIGSTGVVTGVAAGTPNITYTSNKGCVVAVIETVNATPTAISGSAIACVGQSVTLTDASAGGIWTSSRATRVSVGSTTGIITGITTGAVTITYTLNTCSATKTVTGTALPTAILGTPVVCSGSTVTISDATTAGTWSSVSTGVATIGATGIITGVSGGTSLISYLKSGCAVTKTATVNATPQAISGSNSLCTVAGNTITLSDGASGGTWVSSNTAIATMGSTTGIVTAVTNGTATISYTNATCTPAIKPISVNPSPAAISGSTSVCTGANVTLSDATGGGTWSSNATSLATVGSTGIVTGVLAGNPNISYTLSTGCYALVNETVNTMPHAGTISGPSTICSLSVKTMSDLTVGGTWSSSNSAVATIDGTTGVVSGVTMGSVTISYTVISTGCTANATYPVTIGAYCGGARSGGAITTTGAVIENQSYTLLPNPSNGNISILQAVENDGEKSIRIINYVGSVIYDGTIQFIQGKAALNIENAASGIYIVQISNDAGEYLIYKIVIDK